MKNSNDTIGNRTSDLPACSAVPQPPAPPAACPLFTVCNYTLHFHVHSFFLKLLNQKYTLCFVVLYGCETWSLTLREERRLRVFENMVLRRIFGPSRDDVTGE